MSDWHVYPANDLIDHDMNTENCICGPVIEPVPRDDGSVGWVQVHRSLDGRELSEAQS